MPLMLLQSKYQLIPLRDIDVGSHFPECKFKLKLKIKYSKTKTKKTPENS